MYPLVYNAFDLKIFLLAPQYTPVSYLTQ